MGYFLEIFLEGETKKYLRGLSKDPNNYFPHITLVRPFTLNNSEEKIIETISQYCIGFEPINLGLGGRKKFPPNISYVPVNSKELFNFDLGLESILSEEVNFYRKLGPKKLHHVTLDFKDENSKCKEIIYPVKTIVGIKDKKIWFSYDFLNKQLLNREESLERFKIKL